MAEREQIITAMAATPRKEQEDRVVTEGAYNWYHGMEMTWPTTGYSQEGLTDLMDDIAENAKTKLPNEGRDWIIEKAMEANGSAEVVDDLTRQAIKALPTS